ncbi:amino acid ABC transporter ATP-binding protein, partial [Thermophilibacter provencensis]
MPAKHHRRVAIDVPPALPADEAARIAYDHDQGLTSHHFTPGEHPIVRIEHLNKSFDETLVLKDVNLNVWPGEVVVVLGPSGSGKSTMLRCINLLERPSAGHILIEDEEITNKSAAEVNRLRRDVGMVFQQFNLFPHLTVLENCTVAQTKVLKRSTAEARAVATRQLARVGLAELEDRYPDQLSGGQQQRVAI